MNGWSKRRLWGFE